MKNLNIQFFIILILSIFLACNNSNSEDDATVAETEETIVVDPAESQIILMQEDIKLTEVNDSPDFPDAKLTILNPASDVQVDPGWVDFDFRVENYVLTNNTSDANSKLCANSSQGQHIHFILDNQPYTALYEPKFQEEFSPGYHTVLTFLSRSYHESLKHKDAYQLIQIKAGDSEENKVDLDAPHMFYSRPKGTYYGEDTKHVLLDFYLHNVDLSPDGYKVKVSIAWATFTLTKWAPFLVEGLPIGAVPVGLELIDAEGNTVPSPYNPVEYTIQLISDDPIADY